MEWQRRTGRKWEEDLPRWIYEAWHFILARELGLPHKPPRWLKYPAVMEAPISTPQVWAHLGCFKHKLRPFTTVTVPRWLSVKTMEEEVNRLLSRAESKFCTPNGGTCMSKTIGLLVRRHIVGGEFHYGGKEASTRWGSGPDLSMMTESGAVDPVDETFREYERVVDPKYLEGIRGQAKQFSAKHLSRQARLAEDTVRKFKGGRNTIRPRSLRKLTKAIHELQNKNMKN